MQPFPTQTYHRMQVALNRSAAADMLICRVLFPDPTRGLFGLDRRYLYHH